MNRVQFSYPAQGINITKLLIPPKNRTLTLNWLRAARKSIPQIPNLEVRPDWKVYEEIITDRNIIFDIRDSAGNKCALIIERKNAMTPG